MINQQRFVDWIFDTLRGCLAPITVLGFYALGLTFRLFKLFPPLDIPVHFMGGVVITYFYRVAIRNSQNLGVDLSDPGSVCNHLHRNNNHPLGILRKYFGLLCRHQDGAAYKMNVDLFVGLLRWSYPVL